MVSLGNVPRYETAERFRATVKADRAKWAEVVKASGASSIKRTRTPADGMEAVF